MWVFEIFMSESELWQEFLRGTEEEMNEWHAKYREWRPDLVENDQLRVREIEAETEAEVEVTS